MEETMVRTMPISSGWTAGRGDLFGKVARGKLKEEVARKYFQQLISAIDFCHSRGVSHRDLKPENLLLDENEDLKISDFGLSALPEQLRYDGLLHTQCGTPAIFKAQFECPPWFSTDKIKKGAGGRKRGGPKINPILLPKKSEKTAAKEPKSPAKAGKSPKKA